MTGMVILGGVLFIVLKNALTIWIDIYCTDWFLSLYRSYSAKLLNHYYQSGFLYIKKKGSTTLTYEVNSVCYAFVMSVLSPIFQMIGRILLVLLLCIALAVYSPYMALVFILGMTVLIWFYMRVVRKRISVYGNKESHSRKRQWRNVQEIYRGYVEIEINQAFGLFYDRFGKEMNRISSYRKKTKRIKQIPSALFETGMVLVLFALFLIARSNSELVLLLGIFAVAGMRIVPSLQSVVACWTQIQNHRYTVDILSEAISNPHPPVATEERKLTFEKSLTADRVSFAFQPDNALVLRDFTMELKRGEFLGIQGCSGIGKSTLVNLLSGFIQPDSGRILIDGQPLSAANMKEWHRIIGYVPQEVFIMNGTIAENIALGTKREDVDIPKMSIILKQMKLDSWINELPLGIDTYLGENGGFMSGGQKQRIGIARTLYKGARVLFFDEATSALDLPTEEDILRIIRRLPEQGYEITLLMIAHRQSSLSTCDRIISI